MGHNASESSGRTVFKGFGALLLIIFIWLLLIGILGSSESRGDAAATIPSRGNPRRVRLAIREKHSFAWNRDLIYVSKRRVPNGPDPIHNRHVGETRRPSGRV
uniref:CLAVATA3/ESR (CLE)-related protein 25 n=1 Tax=Opuntia streptacantha TaxID=393608 RepID=A0A7C8YVV5_OPUST